MADAWAVSSCSVRASGLPSANLVARFNLGFLRKHRLAPLTESEDDAVVCAAVLPPDYEEIRALEAVLERPVVITIATNTEFERMAAAFKEPARQTDIRAAVANDRDASRLKDLASEEPVVRLVSRLIAGAKEARASDIHIEPGDRETSVRLRVDGRLVEHERLAPAEGLAAVSRIKILAGLDIAERRRPQDGRFSFSVAGREIDLRASTVGTNNGESLVLRLLDAAATTEDLRALGFSEAARASAADLLARPNGIVLVTGPTGSGKTTTLYAFLKSLATGERKMLTIEDPIEYRLGGVAQSQVNVAAGVTFASALRSFLRHDPDVMMVGEIRDLETARIAVQAALTGHLVLSTAHTNDAVSAVTRLRDLGLEPYLIAETLNGVVAQRLVRRVCPTCAGAGCETCRGTGYFGRVALVETLAVDDAVREAIRSNAGETDLRALAKKAGVAALADDARAKIAAGVTTAEEVERVLGRHV